MSGDIVTTVLMQPITGIFVHSKQMYGKVKRNDRGRVITNGFDPLDTLGDSERPNIIRYGVAIATLSKATSAYGTPLLDEKTGRAPFLHALTQSGVATAVRPERRNGNVLEVATALFRRGEETDSLQDIIGNMGLMSWSDREEVISYLRSRAIYQNWGYADLTASERKQSPEERLVHDLGYEWHRKDEETPLTLFPLAIVLGLLQDSPNSRRERARRLTALADDTDEKNSINEDVPVATRLEALTDPLNVSEGLRILAHRTAFRGRQDVLVYRPFLIEGDCDIYDTAQAHRQFETGVADIAQSLAEQLSPTPKKELPYQPPRRSDDNNPRNIWAAGFNP